MKISSSVGVGSSSFQKIFGPVGAVNFSPNYEQRRTSLACFNAQSQVQNFFNTLPPYLAFTGATNDRGPPQPANSMQVSFLKCQANLRQIFSSFSQFYDNIKRQIEVLKNKVNWILKPVDCMGLESGAAGYEGQIHCAVKAH